MAIDVQTKAFHTSVDINGLDHSSTAYSLSTLALYYQ